MNNVGINNLDEKIKKAVSEIKSKKQIVAFYLFGSYAAGRPTPLSDIDIAVLFDNTIKKDNLFDEKLCLLVELSIIFGTDNLDLVILNEAPAGLGYRIIKNGKLLFLRNEAKEQFICFKARLLDRYCDYRPVQDFFAKGITKRIREGSFGGR